MTSGFAEVIGDPISHSRSPLIHSFWLEKLELGFDYRATRVTRTDLPAFLAGRRADPEWRGCNVTMPLKLDALMLADEASDRAVAAGAANLLIAKDGALWAGNTDIGGLLRLLGPVLQTRGSEGGVTVLGNGGAARAALVALRAMGVTEVLIHARDLSAATKLAVEFDLRQGPSAFDQPVRSSGLINATPLGMPGVAPFPIDIDLMPADGWVMDMVTSVAGTPLLVAAGQLGLATIDGITLLVEQASDSFVLLFGHEAPRQHDAELMARLRSL